MNKALCVGIGNYGDGMSLCCDNDAKCLGELISKNENEKANFNVKYVLNKDATKTKLRRELDELFNSNTRNVIFYFSGHGEQEYGDVYLHLYDGKRGDWGISMTEIIGYANESKCKSKVLIFDCCYSGKIGEVKGFNNNCSILSTGTVIIASSRKCEISRINAAEKNSEFTKLLLEAISGGASDVFGIVTPTAVYSYIEKSFAEYEQRPILKANIEKNIVIRKNNRLVSKKHIEMMCELFKKSNIYNLNPSYEPTNYLGSKDRTIQPYKTKENCKIFKCLLSLYKHGLVEPVDAPNMYEAAMNFKACALTQKGQHLVNYLNKC